MDLDTRLSRGRLFAALDAFERDMREILEKNVLDHLSEEEALGPDFAKADEVRSNDTEEDGVPITHYLFLRQCYDVLNRNRAKLAGELAEELRHNTPLMDEFVPLRNRVMHGRPLRGDDPSKAVSILNAFQTRHWKYTHQTLRRLAEEVDWEPAFETQPLPTERVLHNLPLADYDETGLIGRADEVRKLKSIIQRRREAVVTVTGEGGIGKTALALETAYAIVDDPTSEYDCVLWVSLKNELLTVAGIRSIENAIAGVTGAISHLGTAIDGTFSGRVEGLSEALSGLAALIIVDNLESAQGDEVLELYDALPDTVSYLFTSRIGVGQLERRVALSALKASDAELLFRKFAHARDVASLTRLSSTAVAQIVERLRYSPLAIRWYVMSVEAGKEPVATLRDQKQLLDFCIGSVYDALSPRSRALLTVLDAIDRSVSFDELAVLTDTPLDDLRAAAQELGRGAMIVHQPDPSGGVFSRLSLSLAARVFLKTRPGRDSSMSRIQEREEEYRKSAERRRATESSRRFGPGVVRTRSSADEPVVHLLDIALSYSKRAEYSKSQEYVDRARALNPDYWEVDRVAGFIASVQKRGTDATALYKASMSSAQTDEERAIVAFYLAGHLARKMHDLDAALGYAGQAHTYFDSDDTALLLGNLRVWNCEFEEGQRLLEKSLETATGKTYLIAATALVESWRRWAEAATENRQLADAVDKAFSGFSVGAQALGEGYVDLKLASEVIESANACLRAMTVNGGQVDATKVSKIATWLESNFGLARGSRFLPHLSRSLFQVEHSGQLDTATSSKVRAIAQKADASTQSATVGRSEHGLVGEVVSWAGVYGFIRHPEYPGNVYFHSRSLPGTTASELTRGALVSFSVERDEDGRVRATRVSVVASRPRGRQPDSSV